MDMALFFKAIFLAGSVAVCFAQSPKYVASSILSMYEELGREERPVQSDDQILDVTFGINVLQVSDIDYRSQSIEINYWQNIEWDDYYLKWNHIQDQRYDVKSVRLPVKKIFVPDITPYTSASSADLHFDSDAVVARDGTVSYVPPMTQKFSCEVPAPVSREEFNCTLKFGSWTQDGSKLNLTLKADQADLSNYSPHPLWSLLGAPAERHIKVYDCCPEPYIDITYTLRLKYNK